MAIKHTLVLLLTAAALLVPGCMNEPNTEAQIDNDQQQNITEMPYGIVLSVGTKKNNVTVLDDKLNVQGTYTIGTGLQDIQMHDGYLYAIDLGTPEKPKRDMLKIDPVLMKTTQTLSLTSSPGHMVFYKNRALLSSPDQKKGEGFPLMAVDLNDLKVTNTMITNGIASFLKEIGGQFYAGINPGGENNFGTRAQLLHIDPESWAIKNILNEPAEEIPPSDIWIEGSTLYGIYPGYPRGPKPRWVSDPKRYTNMLKTFDLSTGKLTGETQLPVDFPQSMANRDDGIAFINHYTNLDMTGEQITVYDLKKAKSVGMIPASTPAALGLNAKHLLVANYKENRVTVYDAASYEKVKEMPVGKWPSIVRLRP